ncbi:hypothetical protein V1525DRAFT_341005 [Lipomyces kononenkoae]|uniref:Uncharacterized protein n=1 Tax=Lipomyces kononenkoae TaxID=34357 RepID=A0ACC3T589_LIPKO
MNPAAMAGYPHNASVINARLNGIGLPEGMSDVEKQRQQQLARQAALTRRAAAAGGLTPAQIQTIRQQQQLYAQQQQQQQQQHMQQAAPQAGQQGPQPGQPQEPGADGRSDHSPPPTQTGSPSKRQRLSPDGAYSQVASNRFVNPTGQPANNQAAQQMLLNTGMNPAQMNQQFSAPMLQLKQQQAQQQQAQHLQQQTNQQGHMPQQPGLSQAAMQAQQLQHYSSSLMNNHRALLNMSKGQGAAGPGLQPGASHIAGGSPMIAHSSSDQGHPAMYVADAYGQNPAAGQLRMPPGSQQSVGGNTNALQDYQMQLMLLEQQNKRRLMVARQEQQDGVIKQPSAGAPGGPQPGQQAGQPGQGQQPGENITPFPGMSPQQGRLAPSPQPNMDMAKRATPKITNQAIPGSPLPDSQQHPAGQGQQPNSRNASPNMSGGFSGMDQFNVLVGGPGGNNLIMRGVQPSHPQGFNAAHLQQLAADQGGPRPQGIPGRQQMNANLIWTQQQNNGQQMQPGPQQGGQQSMPGQANPQPGGPIQQPQSRQQQQQQMPPPQAPSSAAPRASASPSMASTPITAPTPPPAKMLPKGKKEPREPKKRTKKQQAAVVAAAAAAAGNPPVTPSATPGPTSEPPTPTTPITPQRPISFPNGNAGGAANNVTGGANPLLLKATTFSASQNSATNTSNISNPSGNASGPPTSATLTASAAPAPAPQTSEAPSSFLDADAPSLFPDFGTGTDGDIGDLEFDINTFLNTDDATAGGLNFDPTSAFTWNESVEATSDV